MGTVYYLRFCCRVRISTAKSGPYDVVMATEPGDRSVAEKRAEQFSDYATGDGWFMLSEPLLAHLKALKFGVAGHHRSRLVSTADAEVYTGRGRATIHRWAKEGRITNHGTPNRALWDVWELPAYMPNGTNRPPPSRSP